MPRRSNRYISVCGKAGCPTLTDQGYCDEHRRLPDKRPTARDRGYDSEWQKVRAEFLRAYPSCQDPEGCIARATDVDHLDGRGPNGPRGQDWSNLRALCHRHHSKRTAQDQPGGWHSGVRKW